MTYIVFIFNQTTREMSYLIVSSFFIDQGQRTPSLTVY